MDDTRAVSPVIATILVVAITVILAAVIGSSLLGLTSTLKEPAPVVSLSVADAPENAPPPRRSTNGEITNWAEISHNNGDIIHASDLKILIKNSSGTTVATLQQSNSYSALLKSLESYMFSL
ncbi:archaeal flagellin N-terminal-like domain protein [Halorubrum sp. AJ67]|nr:archaeal flagellin N-terminal-like domain protein [Halorubrum sp. AJ67]